MDPRHGLLGVFTCWAYPDTDPGRQETLLTFLTKRVEGTPGIEPRSPDSQSSPLFLYAIAAGQGCFGVAWIFWPLYIGREFYAIGKRILCMENGQCMMSLSSYDRQKLGAHALWLGTCNHEKSQTSPWGNTYLKGCQKRLADHYMYQ